MKKRFCKFLVVPLSNLQILSNFSRNPTPHFIYSVYCRENFFNSFVDSLSPLLLPREKIFGIITIRNLKEEFFMVTNNLKVVCPKCGSANCYSLTSLQMYDNDLHATYSCDVCETEFTNVYTLVYLGGHTSVYEYDRDNIFISAKGTVATVG